MLGGIQGAGAAVLIDAEGDEGEEHAEDDGRLHHAVVVQLAQELGAADAPLVELGLVDLVARKMTFCDFQCGPMKWMKSPRASCTVYV